MSEPFWLGGIYIKHEGGYEIILKSLKHYKKRLKTLGQSPELQNSAAMFASVLNQEARKTIPIIDDTIEKIYNVLRNVKESDSLYNDVQFLEKALSCYQSDIQKAQDTGNEYFVKLVGNMKAASNDLEPINTAKRIIKNTCI